MDWFGPAWSSPPIAHRGYHDNAAGVIENSVSAFQAAIDRGYAIEIDLQAASDLEPMVFHDKKLDRLTALRGRVSEHSSTDLQQVVYANSSDRIMSLRELLDFIAGRVPLLVEIKPKRRNTKAFGRRVGEILRDYDGPVSVMSFDPDLVAACLETAPAISRGLTISYLGMTWPGIVKFIGMYIRIGWRIRPQFVAYNVRSLPGITPVILRYLFRLKLFVWTVRTDKQREKARRWADAMIFEGFEA